MSEAQNETRKADILRMTADVAAAYFSKNTVALNQVPELIRAVYASLKGVATNAPEGGSATKAGSESGKPAVPVRKSVTQDYLICLEDGKKLKMLKRHLRTVYNMTPEQYRAKWNLAADYPMVAPGYAEQRSVFAKKIGLGKDAAGRAKRAKRVASA